MNFICPLMPGALVSTLKKSDDAFNRTCQLYQVYFSRVANSRAWNASHLPYEERQALANEAEYDAANLRRDTAKIKLSDYAPLIMWGVELLTYAGPFIAASEAVIRKQGGLSAALFLLGAVVVRNFIYAQSESLFTRVQIEINELESKLGYQETA